MEISWDGTDIDCYGMGRNR